MNQAVPDQIRHASSRSIRPDESRRRALGFGMCRRVLGLILLGLGLVSPRGVAADTAEEQLAGEVAARGWVLFAARTPAGDYDLLLMRPNGTAVRNLTRTPQFSEYGGRFSPDGKRMLYRRAARGTEINHDLWGATGVPMVASADGANPQPLGPDGELPWASWSPDGRQVACLYKRQGRIRIVDVETRTVVKDLPRQGIFQQMYWSPDGQRLVGTANRQGQDWNIVTIELRSGNVTQVSRNLACTPDWFQGDSQRVLYSNRTPGLGSDYGWTYLMESRVDGGGRRLVYAEQGRHIYYGGTSPDDRYVILSTPVSDGGTDAELAIVRLADAPIVVPASYTALSALHAGAKHGPVLRLKQAGFEPHWTYAEIPAP